MVDAPTSWADLWDPKFKGKLAMPDLTASGSYQVLVMAAKINGGDENNIDPGFEAHEAAQAQRAQVLQVEPGGGTALRAWRGRRCCGLV